MKIATLLYVNLVTLFISSPMQSAQMSQQDAQRFAAANGASAAAQDSVVGWSLEHELLGHTSSVTSVVYSPDGKHMASGSFDCSMNLELFENCAWDTSVRVWSAENGVLEHVLEGASGPVVYSPDGKHVASGSADASVIIWGAASGRAEHVLAGCFSRINSVVYSPDGKHIATGDRGGGVRIWSAESGKEEWYRWGRANWVNSVAYSPDGKHIASGGGAAWEGGMQILSAASGGWEHELGEGMGEVYSIVYSPDGKHIASGFRDGRVRIWNVESGVLEHEMEGHQDYVFSVAYSPDGRHIASGGGWFWDGRDNTVRIWSTETGKEEHKLEGHGGIVWSVVYSPDGKHIASRSHDGTVRIWNTESGKEEHKLGHGEIVWSVVYSPDGKHIASGAGDGRVRIWSSPENNLEIEIERKKREQEKVIALRTAKSQPLIEAVAQGNVAKVKELLTQSDIDVNIHDKDGMTVLIMAAKGTKKFFGGYKSLPGHLEIIQALLADPRIAVNVVDWQGRTALMWAASNGFLPVVEALLKHPQIKVDVEGKDGSTALLLAAQNGHRLVAKALAGHSRGMQNAAVPSAASGSSASMAAAPVVAVAASAVWQQQLNGFVALPPASTPGNCEIVDIRFEGDRDVGILADGARRVLSNSEVEPAIRHIEERRQKEYAEATAQENLRFEREQRRLQDALIEKDKNVQEVESCLRGAVEGRQQLEERLAASRVQNENLQEQVAKLQTEHAAALAQAQARFEIAQKQLQETLEEQKEKAEQEKICTICEERPKNAVLIPCGHICCCSVCGEDILQRHQTCPICRGPIERVNRIFQS